MLNDQAKAVNGSTLLVYGLAYKANTSDARETPSRPVITQLQDLGASVLLAEPHVAETQFPAGVEHVGGGPADLERCDMALYLVDHGDFDRAQIAGAGIPVLDCRRALDGETVQRL
ncbi:MAG: UDP binding domain-containing protein [Microthrixaceae bacterium]|nr:UDP binding domain-containing protein [Microthrixaceae bacterium]